MFFVLVNFYIHGTTAHTTARYCDRTKHIAIKYQYVNECVQNGSVVIDFVRSKDNYSDMFTKPVGPVIFLGHSCYVMG